MRSRHSRRAGERPAHASRAEAGRTVGVRRGRAALLLVVLLAAWAPASGAAELPKVSHDGLHLVKQSRHGALYVKPGASLATYDRLLILECFVAFKKHWREEDPDRFRVTKHDMEAIKKHLAEEFHRVFVQELQGKGGYEVVDAAAPDVLLLRPAIVNLDVEAPDTMEPDEESFSASAGQMTLYLELYDSVTSDILARIIDAEAADDEGGMIEWRNSVTNKAAADRILKKWADRLRKRLDEAHEHAKP